MTYCCEACGNQTQFNGEINGNIYQTKCCVAEFIPLHVFKAKNEQRLLQAARDLKALVDAEESGKTSEMLLSVDILCTIVEEIDAAEVIEGSPNANSV